MKANRPHVTTYQDDTLLRIDTYLKKLHPGYSRSYIASVITSGMVMVNQKPVKPSQRLHKGDRISLNKSDFTPKRPKEIRLPIIYEDEDVIVINKPSGLITHLKGAASEEPSVASFIKPYLESSMHGNRAGIVHRLDRGTSGLIIAAKTPEALLFLQRQFALRKVKKTYIAVVRGKLENSRAIINMPIERNPKLPSTFRTGVNGKSAITNYMLMQDNANYSLVELKPETGRTHQLRVHLKAIGHPIVGDTIYGGEVSERLMLHASVLELTLPKAGRQVFISNLPPEFNKFALKLDK